MHPMHHPLPQEMNVLALVDSEQKNTDTRLLSKERTKPDVIVMTRYIPTSVRPKQSRVSIRTLRWPKFIDFQNPTFTYYLMTTSRQSIGKILLANYKIFLITKRLHCFADSAGRDVNASIMYCSSESISAGIIPASNKAI